MLRRLAALATLALAQAAHGEAAPQPSGLIPLLQLTAGGADAFFGQLHPDGQRLVFASNLNGTVELFTQPLTGGGADVLFDERADVSQPRLSPDGSRLLFLSYRDDAFGDACVLELTSQARRCLPVEGAALHAFWLAGGREVGVVSRRELGGAHTLVRFALSARRAEEGVVLAQGYFSAPVASPDGRWLAFARLEPAGGSAPAALLRASRGLVLQPLAGGAPVDFQPLLPGTSAFPAFSVDGRHLYFTQFPDDTNADGVTDGNDNGLLARVPVEAGAQPPVRGEAVEVLTSRRTNCQYPMPARDRLIATCTRHGRLQLMSLPLEGQVPARLSQAQLEDEAAASRHRWERLLLHEHRLHHETDPEEEKRQERRLAMAYLALGAFDSAEFDLRLIQGAVAPASAEWAWAAVAIELVRHRRDEARLGFAKLSEGFVAAEQARLERLEGYDAHASQSVARLARLVRAEVLRVLGQKVEALALLDGVDVAKETDPDVALLWGRLCEVLLREYGHRERLAKAELALSAHPALGERERLLHARRFLDSLTRGRDRAERLAALAAARSWVQPGSEAELLLDVEVALDEAEPSRQAEVVERLDRLWRRAPSFEQHRMVAMTTIERAAHDDLEHVLEVLGQRWLDEVPRAHAERKYAEALFAEVQLERAYVELQHKEPAAAAQHFLAIATRTGSLEAISGYVEAAARAQVTPAKVIASLIAAVGTRPELFAFAEASLLGRRLHDEAGAELDATLARARRLLEAHEHTLARAAELHHLLGFLAHEDFHRGNGGKTAAVEAHRRYHLALELAPEGYRRRASLLLELGLLQGALGNHRIALRHYDERSRLPFVRPAEQAAFHLSRARSLFLAGEAEPAARESARALAFVEEVPALARFRPLALERAMVCHLAAGAPQKALELGEALLPHLPPSAAAQVKVRLALASAHLAAKDAPGAIARLGEAKAVLAAHPPLHTAEALAAHGPTHLTEDDLRALVEGLDAQARARAGDLVGRKAALDERYALLAKRQQLAPRDETLHELARVAYQQAQTAARLQRWAESRAHLEAGLAHSAAWREHTGARVDAVSVALLELCAQASLSQPDACPLPRATLVAGLEEAAAAAAKMKTREASAWRWSLPPLLTRLAAGGVTASTASAP